MEEFSTVKWVKSQQTALELCSEPRQHSRVGTACTEAARQGEQELQHMPSTKQMPFT